MTNSVVFSFNMSKNLKVSRKSGQVDILVYALVSKLTPKLWRIRESNP